MVRNNIEIDIKIKCVEEQMTQAKLAKKVGTPASYVNKLIRRDEGIVNNTYVKIAYCSALIYASGKSIISVRVMRSSVR